MLNGSPTLSMPALSSVGVNSGVLSFAIAVLDRRLALRRVEPLALRRGEDEVQDRALLGGELATRSGRSPSACPSPGSRTRPSGSPPTVATRTMRAAMIPSHAEDDAPRVRRARAHPAREPAGRQSFVCCETIVLFRHAQPPSSRCGYDPPASRNSSVDCVNRGQRTRHPISSLLPTAGLGYSTAFKTRSTSRARSSGPCENLMVSPPFHSVFATRLSSSVR